MSKTGPKAFLVRQVHDLDRDFIIGTWLDSARDSYAYMGIPTNLYYTKLGAIAESLVDRATVLLACDPDMPDVAYGFIVAEVIDESVTVHYCYVKRAWRRMGIMTLLWRRLLEHERDYGRHLVVTHRSKAFKAWFETNLITGVIPKHWTLVYNPFVMYATMEPGWYETN